MMNKRLSFFDRGFAQIPFTLVRIVYNIETYVYAYEKTGTTSKRMPYSCNHLVNTETCRILKITLIRIIWVLVFI